MILKTQILSAVLAFAFPLTAAAQLSGTVYHDTNADGIRNADEKPIAGVAVTDGLNVVKTDARGRFELPGGHPQARFVTVTTPSGYKPLGDHYLAIEQGRNSYDFGLVKSPHTGAFEFIQVTDSETNNHKPWIDNLKEYAASNPATAFIIHTGDICYTPGLDFHAAHVRTRQTGVPMYYTIGNHDLVKGDYGEQYFQRLFGPNWYSFDVGNVHFVALPMLGGDYNPSYRLPQVLAWLRNDLAQADPRKRLILLCHDLWFQEGDLVIRHRTGRNRAVTDSLDLSEYNAEAWLYGHWHNHYVKYVQGLKTISTSTPDKGGIDHSPSCFRVISVDAAGNVTARSRSVYTGIDGTLSLALPARHDTVPAGTVTLRVNAYRTVSPVVAVEVTVDGRKTALTQQTDWAWSGALASGTKPGLRTVRVEARCADGTRLEEQSSFYVSSGAVPTVTPSEEWGNLAGNAAHNQPVIGGDISAMPACVWSQNAGGNIFMGSPVVGGGNVYIATLDDDNIAKCSLIAYDAATGTLEWRRQTGNSVKNTIVYGDGTVFVCGADMTLWAFDGTSGELRWKRELRESMLPVNDNGIAYSEGVVYAGHSSGFSAVDARTGRVLWKNRAWSGGEGTSSTTTAGEGVVLASSHWNGLFAHDAATGELLWKKQDAEIRFRDGSATLYDGNIYLASSNTLFLINPRSGDVLKSQKADGIDFRSASAPVVTPQAVYTGTSNRGVAAFDRLTFKPLWNYRTAPSLFYTVPYAQDWEMSVETVPVLIGGTLVFGASDGCLYGIDAATGRFQWKRNLGAPVFSSPAVSSDALYVADFSGNIYCFRFERAE